MLLSINENPKNSLYYNGFLVLSVMREDKEYDYFELYGKLKEQYNMNMHIYILTLDWLYIISAITQNKGGWIKKMFIKQLCISDINGPIRQVQFHDGLNLIVDKTKSNLEHSTKTGNNIGKTTVLKLIYFCFGGDAKEIYASTENKKDEYKLIKEFLEENEVLISLLLKDDLGNENSKEIMIERNFLKRKRTIRRINNTQYTEEEFEKLLKKLLFSSLQVEKPTLKQLVGHNIRYKDNSINNTLRFLNSYTNSIEYETLYLFLLGCSHINGDKKEKIASAINQETQYKKRIEISRSKNEYIMTLSAVNNEIDKLNQKKKNLNINEEFDSDLTKLNCIKCDINHVSESISQLELRRDLISESLEELNKESINIDIEALKTVYNEVNSYFGKINRSFENLVLFHNQMIENKIKFIKENLPSIEQKLSLYKSSLSQLLDEGKKLSIRIQKSDTFADMDRLTQMLNTQFQKKGEYESRVSQIQESEAEIKKLNDEMSIIDEEIYSDEYQDDLKNRVTEFNEYFKNVSKFLYDEEYLLNYEIKVTKTGQKFYDFNIFQANISSGKKQGEILCFDIALILFSKKYNLEHLGFILNDKKELMDDNQLRKVASYAKKAKVQLIFPMLEDKVPPELNNEDNIILRLSQEDKLFRVE